jgi:hypothetical protein
LFSGNNKGLQEGQGEKKHIWGANFRVSSLGDTQRIVTSKPDPYTKDMKRICVYVTDNHSVKDKEVVRV